MEQSFNLKKSFKLIQDEQLSMFDETPTRFFEQNIDIICTEK